MNFAVCIQEPDNAVIGAECAALTGVFPEADGFASTSDIAAVSRAAYLRFGARAIAHAETLDELLAQISSSRFPTEDFRIELTRLSDAPKLSKTSELETIIAVADAMDAYPNLKSPTHRFALVIRKEGLWFGEIVAEPDRSWERHDGKPYRTSSSLPSRLSRALVNLISKPGEVVLDPCCGTGSILLEAVAIGATAHGADNNPRMVGMSRANLAHFGYSATVEFADARVWARRGDAVVTDLPYGKNSLTTEENLRGILNHAATLAPKGVFVAGADISDWLTAAGYGDVRVYSAAKSTGFVRHVHVAG